MRCPAVTPSSIDIFKYFYQSTAIIKVMNLTSEQLAIIGSTGDIKINAVAGSGKTTTIIEYARAQPKTARILYLAFNRSVKMEAEKRFLDKGLLNVKVETAHSLAFKNVVYRNNYKVRPQGYKTHEIAELLGLKGSGEKHAEYIVANHINKFLTYFCNSDKLRVHDLNYLDVMHDEKARSFVANFYDYIQSQTRLLLSKMDKGEIEVIHDFYLKKFQLSQPLLPYDYILFDEGQDASAAMLDIFLKQPAVKVIVGDTHQQIYAWRYAVNSLDKASFTQYQLSTSFRFGQDVADLGVETLNLKNLIIDHKPAIITGAGNTSGVATKAVLARTNLGLLLKAIEYVQEKADLRNIYFEGNINSYTYADEGASLYDVLHLYNGKGQQIRDNLIKAMKDMEELEDYIEKTEDVQLGMMVEIVKEYGNRIPGIIKSIKDRHVPDNEKDKASIIFSTVHRSKGMEYDAVQLVNDFITEERITKVKADTNTPVNVAKLIEEINLLYVAITRTKNILHIPEQLLPKDFKHSPNIKVIKEAVKNNKYEGSLSDPYDYGKYRGKKSGKQNDAKQKSYEENMVTKKPSQAYKPWDDQEDVALTEMYCERKTIKEIVARFNRTVGAIKSRIKKLELHELYD